MELHHNTNINSTFVIYGTSHNVGKISDTDLSVGIHSAIVITYSESTHTMKLYFNGGSPVTSSASIDEPIDWSTR